MSAATDVDALLRLMPPPQDGGTAIDWEVMARSWGRPFPPDYRRFIEEYGAGTIEDFLVIDAPQLNVPLEEAGLDGMVQETMSAEGVWDMAEKSPELEETSPRLISWGVDAAADLMCWDASGEDPATWPVLVFNRSDNLFRRYDCGMAEFLTRMMRGSFPECPLEDDTVWERGEASWEKR
ncbi:hypothetical protein DV517_75050 [Streptomyces sp. S816]|uniref:hypothetical protein n=1 Tax=Streptomyces sp. S816 TaxID=2283197 RepID=UPI001138BF1A|nr:hypothetical protein [Streptomyces sp. S816]TGZ12410.1 hypothetical protein DV517_75050 [Streptomyces sp. S816]